MKTARLQNIVQTEEDEMNYSVKTIETAEELQACQVFCVDRYNWGGDYRPVTYGRMGYWKNHGFLVEMVSEEKNPAGACTEPDGMVCRETAMEAFFQFFPQDEKEQFYLNFEANVLGTLHVKFGRQRKERQPLPKDLREACNCRCQILENCWKLKLLVPLEVIEYVYKKNEFHSGDSFKCNFYKISEVQEPVHFGSYTEIKSEKPDFHLPEYFAEAVIE